MHLSFCNMVATQLLLQLKMNFLNLCPHPPLLTDLDRSALKTVVRVRPRTLPTSGAAVVAEVQGPATSWEQYVLTCRKRFSAPVFFFTHRAFTDEVFSVKIGGTFGRRQHPVGGRVGGAPSSACASDQDRQDPAAWLSLGLLVSFPHLSL